MRPRGPCQGPVFLFFLPLPMSSPTLQALVFNLPGYSRWASLTNGVAIRIGDR